MLITGSLRNRPDDYVVRRNKDRTKLKLIQAAGSVLHQYGLAKTTSAAIARSAGVDRKLIARYFTSLQGLLEAYVIQQDYWLTYARDLRKDPNGVEIRHVREIIIGLLVNQFTYFYDHLPMQSLILMEIGNKTDLKKTDLMSSISRIRESRGADFLLAAENYFEGTGIDIRALLALAIGGSYYSTLHSKNNVSTFCGLNLRDPGERDRIRQGLKSLVTLAFDAAAAIKSVEQDKEAPGHEAPRDHGLP